ncbi:hypothetical protein HETIRDRAFT_120858 [Heterobasidion irregulare TC 32-1]|uniref:Protein kinase domain-containing protein n=1 Tax=Heterobasidion irregulare (strain TC 32-1) TaxID=747525 RepID=W4KC44_HETIT|nr:uncharacterized protein HETIRDRAFT_120858 [Heterobasidion irregulare TC 32-1]ETW82651.1 hypothetical protein HETIRDRAFT_120858 [Heterobasidion irregulare TC 32-1]
MAGKEGKNPLLRAGDQMMTKHPSCKAVMLLDLALEYGAIDFADALADFVILHNQPNLYPTLACKAANNLLILFQRLSIFHKIKFWNHDAFECEEGSDTLDVVHVRNARKDCQGHAVPGCFDTVLIDDGSVGPRGMTGLRIAQVHIVFKLSETVIAELFEPTHLPPPQHFAYVEWFTSFLSAPDPDHGLYIIKYAMQNEWHIAKMTVYYVISAALHLYINSTCAAQPQQIFLLPQQLITLQTMKDPAQRAHLKHQLSLCTQSIPAVMLSQDIIETQQCSIDTMLTATHCGLMHLKAIGSPRYSFLTCLYYEYEISCTRPKYSVDRLDKPVTLCCLLSWPCLQQSGREEDGTPTVARSPSHSAWPKCMVKGRDFGTRLFIIDERRFGYLGQTSCLLKSSPVNNKKSTTERFSTSTRTVPANEDYIQLIKEMRSQFVGPMPPNTFLRTFMPKSEGNRLSKGYHALFADLKIEKGFEKNFIQAVRESGLCPGLLFVDTNDQIDGNFHRKPDICVYKSDHEWAKTNFPLMEFHIERKPDSYDPFHDPPQDMKRSLREKYPFEHNTINGNHSREQISSYTASQFSVQSRAFTFSLLFVGKFVRFIRWDRAGAVVTSRIDWREKPWCLASFLWRFGHSSDNDRGYDTSVSIPTQDEILRTKAALRQRAIDVAVAQGGSEKDILTSIYSSDDTFRKFRVVDDGPDRQEHFFVASVPQWYTSSPTGRGTKGYEALDVATGKMVYLKDTWRYVALGFEKEGDTYRLLEEKKVQRIPHRVCSGDIEGQETRTHEFIKQKWCCRVAIQRHHHYRLVLGDLGRPLSQYTSTKELSQVMLDTIEAHQQAFNAGVLHQDISGGNILITDNGRGLLIDWDLSRRTELAVPAARLKSRTGTWQFMACARLLNPGNKTHEFWHDLESFFHVFLYHAILYQASRIPTTDDSSRIFEQIEEFFDSSSIRLDVPDTGGKFKLSFFQLTPTHFVEPDLSKFLNEMLLRIIFDLRDLFVPLYIARGTRSKHSTANSLPSLQAAQDELKSCSSLTEIFRTTLQLQGWTEDRSDGLFGKPPINRNIKRSAKRKGKDSELDNKPKQKKKKSRVSQNVSEIVVSSLVLGSSSIDEESDISDS